MDFVKLREYYKIRKNVLAEREVEHSNEKLCKALTALGAYAREGKLYVTIPSNQIELKNQKSV